MGKETGYITYRNDNKIHPLEIVPVKAKPPPVEKPHIPLLLVMAGVVTCVTLIAFFIILKIACRNYRTRIGERDHRQQSLLRNYDGGTGDSIQISEPSSTESSLTETDVQSHQIRQHSMNIGVFYPHFPKEFNLNESPLDTRVQRMIKILKSLQALDVKYLKPDFINCFDEIDIITSSPKIIIVLCDRLNELLFNKTECVHGENTTEASWRQIESNLLKTIRTRYYEGSGNNPSLYFVNFKDIKQQSNVLTAVREKFTSQSYRIYSIGSLDEGDDHLKELMDSILFDIISNTEERRRRIDMILSKQNGNSNYE
ncbi:uncharacterized protein LOC117330549 [Pecten maximus]|uniref:uncharacterized protein LOC117330549 n=1 Tax=Pecten maximus TaxID=6579 RepID=UPI0014580CF0|nr:uncharacterized protein LOC117330549 [Pecten maximus]